VERMGRSEERKKDEREEKRDLRSATLSYRENGNEGSRNYLAGLAATSSTAVTTPEQNKSA
jgi:hypothetical protein